MIRAHQRTVATTHEHRNRYHYRNCESNLFLSLDRWYEKPIPIAIPIPIWMLMYESVVGLQT